MPLPSFWPSPSLAAFGSARIGVGPRRADGVDMRPRETPLVYAPTPESPLLVEAHPAESAAAHREAWADLVRRSLEPNVFCEPSFALTAAQHFAAARRPLFILVWALEAGGGRTLLAVCPLTRSRLPIARRTADVWFHDLCTLGSPLLDRDYAEAALQAILAWVAARLPGCGALSIHAVPGEGATALALERVARTTGRRIHPLDARRRAALERGAEPERSGLAALSRKKAKDLMRQGRRLAERGELRYRSARGGDELREAVEQFLLLEAKGWKGARGTALLADTSRAAFARTMTRLLAREGKCRVDSLTLDGAAVASGILLSSGDRDFFWKMAYAEDLASLSPGVQFVLGLTEAQLGNPAVALTDSCAIPDHPMIDRLWRDRLPIVDVLIAVTPGPSPRFQAALTAEIRRRRARTATKRLVGAIRALRHPWRRPASG